MAPRRSSAGPPARAAKQPEKQSAAVLAVCYICLPLALLAFMVGIGGVAVLMDEPDRTHWYSNTKFADTWRWAVEKNPFYATICVNGGMVTMLFLGTKLWEHRKALRLERQLKTRAKARKAE